jgi:hypothetical protein
LTTSSSIEAAARASAIAPPRWRSVALARRLLPVVVGAVLAAPSFVWAAIDRSIWEWDQSGYGIASIQLWVALRLDPSSWLSALFNTRPWRPPAIFWLGEFFVPLRHVVGSVQVAMLLSVEVTLAATLALLFVACRRLAEGRALPALAGTIVAASAPMVVNISHQYLVETIQTAAVVWVLFVMISARRWHPAVTLAQLAAAVSFGLLTKLSTPLYVAAPAAVAVIVALSNGVRIPRWWRAPSFVASAALATGLVLVTGAWYAHNFQQAWDHAKLSADSPLYGPQASFTTRLDAWLGRFGEALFLPYFDFALVALLLLGLGVFLARHRLAARATLYRWLVLAGCVGSVVPALVFLSTQTNTDSRFIIPTIPGIAVGLAALLVTVGSKRLAVLIALLLTGQFALMTLQSFDANAPAQIVDPHGRSVPVARSNVARQLDEIVRYTCDHTPGGRVNTVGASYPWLSANTVNLLSLEQFAGGGCSWQSIGDGVTDPELGWQALTGVDSPFLLTMDFGNPRNQLPGDLAAQVSANANLNVIDVPVLRRALRSGRYTIVPSFRRSGLLLLQRSTRP